MNFKIERDVGLPPSRAKYPWTDLQVEDCIVFSNAKYNTINSALSNHRKKNPDKAFAVRREDDNIVVYRTK